MKKIEINLYKCWDARIVAAMAVDAFISDKAHAIEGLSEAENAAALKQVHEACTAALAEPAIPAKQNTGKK